jgi:hypothetical protein
MINSGGPAADEDQVMAESPRNQIKTMPAKTTDHAKPSKASILVAKNQINTSSGAIEESKGANNRAAATQPEEEKKNVGATSSNDIIKINID